MMIRTRTFHQNVTTCCLSMIIKDKIIGTCRRAKLMMKCYRNFHLKVKIRHISLSQANAERTSKIRHISLSQANAERTSKFYKFMQKRASHWSLLCRRGIDTWLYNFSSYMATNENIKYSPYLFCKYSFGFNQQLVSTHYYRMTIHKYITGYGGKTQVHAGKVCSIY
jgi:hypothetical protein